MSENKMLEGKKAPAFTLPDTYGEKVALNKLKGFWVVLYFYPKDNTPGCTTEALEFTVKLKEFKKHNAHILGVSPDSCKSHEKFIVKHTLEVKLLSDEDHTIIEKYGVWKLKKMYGKEYYGVERSTFLINPEGKVVKQWNKVKVKGHVDEVLDVLKKNV